MKRIELVLNIININNKILLPSKHSMSSFIYNELMTKEDSSKIHNLSNYKLKNFGFNGITFYKFKFIDNNKILLLNNKAFLSIFSVDDVFIENIAKNINKNKIYRIDGMFFNVTNYRIINKQFIGNNFVLKTVDPFNYTIMVLKYSVRTILAACWFF